MFDVRVDGFYEDLMIFVDNLEQEETILVEYVEGFQVDVERELDRVDLERQEIDAVRCRFVVAYDFGIFD